MSTQFAIAGVTGAMKALLHDALNQTLGDLGDFRITTQPPERLAQEEQKEAANRLNLFLYRVTPNTGWTNERMPSRNRNGDRLTNPYLALDLHYLLTAYGRDDLHAEMLLGSGMQVLHEAPVLPRERLRQRLKAGINNDMIPAPFKPGDADALADQVEQIRISPHYIDSEETSRLWSALNTGARPSAMYRATVVLIESRASTRVAPPVGERKLHVTAMNRPRIERLMSDPDPGTPPPDFAEGRVILHGHRIALFGTGLRAADTEVRIGDRPVPVGEVEINDRRCEFMVPSILRPGIHGVQVLHRVVKQSPSIGRIPIEVSNTIAFALSPTLVSVEVTESNVDESQSVTGTVRVVFAHEVAAQQDTMLLLNEVRLEPPLDRESHAYAFAAPASSGVDEAVSQIDFAIRDIRPAVYLVRVRIDGTVSDVRVALGEDLPPNVQELADANIYSEPVIDLSAP